MLNSIKIKGLFLFAFIFTVSLTTQAQIERKTVKTERVATPDGTTKTVESKKGTVQGAAAETTEKVSTPKDAKKVKKVKKAQKKMPTQSNSGKTYPKDKVSKPNSTKKDKVSTPNNARTKAQKTYKGANQTTKGKVSTPNKGSEIIKNKPTKQVPQTNQKPSGTKKDVEMSELKTKKTKAKKINGKKSKSIKNAKVKGTSGARTKKAKNQN